MDRLTNAVTWCSNRRQQKAKRFVYLIRCGEFYKIGVTTDIKDRMGELQTATPYDLELMGEWSSNEPYTLEATLHSSLGAYRIRGEWFKLPAQLVHAIMLIGAARWAQAQIRMLS